MTTTTFEHIAAREDRDLVDRFIAAAEKAGVPDARLRVMESLPSLIAIPIIVNGEETTVTHVHAYAASVRREYLAEVQAAHESALADPRALAPGLNPGAITDDHLRAALAAVLPTTPDASASA